MPRFPRTDPVAEAQEAPRVLDAQHVHELVQGWGRAHGRSASIAALSVVAITELPLELLNTSLLHCKLNFCFPMNVLSIWTIVP